MKMLQGLVGPEVWRKMRLYICIIACLLLCFMMLPMIATYILAAMVGWIFS